MRQEDTTPERVEAWLVFYRAAMQRKRETRADLGFTCKGTRPVCISPSVKRANPKPNTFLQHPPRWYATLLRRPIVQP